MIAPRVIPIVAAALGLIVWLLLLLIAPGPAMQGWFAASFACALPLLGAVAWSLIHRLTGGEWGETFAPVLSPLTRAAPLALVAFLPVFFALPWIFPWARGEGVADVRAAYMNPPFFIARTALILAVLGAAGWCIGEIKARSTPVLAGVVLVFFGFAISILGVDWSLSLLADWTSSAAGMVLAVEALAAALGLVALLAPPGEGRNWADLSGLLFTTLLASSYLGYMSYLVVWYGDRPPLDRWYLIRRAEPWAWGPGIAFLIGGVIPSIALILRDRIGHALSLRIAGGASLLGLLIYVCWQTVPAFGPACLPALLAALIGQAGCIAWAARIIVRRADAAPIAGGVHAGA